MTKSESRAETVEQASAMICDVPGRLASAERELQRLCQWDTGSVSLEAKVTLVNCCRLLRASVSELTALLDYANGPHVGSRRGVPPEGRNLAGCCPPLRAPQRRVGDTEVVGRIFVA